MNKCILSFLLILASNTLWAKETQSLDLLRSKIESHVLNELTPTADGKVQVSAGHIDSRLSLKACAEDKLEVFNPYQNTIGQSNTLGIKCQELNNHWSLYVSVKVSVLKTIFLAKHPLIKGRKITNEDVYAAEIDVQKLKKGYFTNLDELVGQVCKQAIAVDTPLTPYHIELAKLIRKGEQVTIVAGNNGLTIKMVGIAQNDGALGETVQVKNSMSKRTVEAHVIGKKKVRVVV